MEKEQLGYTQITKAIAKEVHDYLYSEIKLSDQDKATLIAGILIALENESFKNTYEQMTDEDQFVEQFMSAIKYSILKFDGLKNHKQAVISVFDFIKHNQNFKIITENNGQTVIALQLLTGIIERSIYKISKEHPEYDILGEFYNEFTRHSGSDQQSLGIALTPHHISHFMAELLQVNDTDVLLDLCAGTGTLLLTADMKSHETNKIVGVEFNARMLSLAVANAMIRKLDSYLLLGNSFDPAILDEVQQQKPTKLIINPPYSQSGYPELGFVKRGLDSLQPGGLGVAILPMSTAIKNDGVTKKLKAAILDQHKLLATFSMPDQLFYPVGVVTIVMLFEAYTKHEGATFFGSLKNDGFEITRTDGRSDTKELWIAIKEQMMDWFNNQKIVNDLSAVEVVSFDMEWSSEAYIKNDLLVSKEDFITELKDYVLFKLRN
jgi:type I restriction-modification system DNA methylase subunit